MQSLRKNQSQTQPMAHFSPSSRDTWLRMILALQRLEHNLFLSLGCCSGSWTPEDSEAGTR